MDIAQPVIAYDNLEQPSRIEGVGLLVISLAPAPDYPTRTEWHSREAKSI